MNIDREESQEVASSSHVANKSPSKCDADRFVRCAVMVHVIPSRTQSL